MAKYLTVKDIQDILQIGKNKAYNLCALKGFPAIKIGTTYRVEESLFNQWMADNVGTQIFL